MLLMSALGPVTNTTFTEFVKGQIPVPSELGIPRPRFFCAALRFGAGGAQRAQTTYTQQQPCPGGRK